MKKFLAVFILLASNLLGFGQTDPVYGQYMFNPVIINPAYAGLHDMASVYGVYRSQWTGVEGLNPETFTLSGQTTLPQNNLAVGFSYVYDQYGYLESHDFNALASYKLNLGNKNLSFGIQGGAVSVQYNYDDVNLKEDDVEFDGIGNGSGIAPSLGFGMLYNSRVLFLGISMPRAIDVEIEDGSNSGTKIYKNFIATGGYVFHIKNSMKLKPSVLLRWNEGADLVYDLNFSVLFNDKIWGGLSVRSFNTLAVMSQLKLSDYLTAGASYEIPIDGKNVSQLGSTFELMLNCNMSLFDVQAVQTIFY